MRLIADHVPPRYSVDVGCLRVDADADDPSAVRRSSRERDGRAGDRLEGRWYRRLKESGHASSHLREFKDEWSDGDRPGTADKRFSHTCGTEYVRGRADSY